MSHDVLKTPGKRFEDLPDYPFEPNYITCQGYRIHYIDEGEQDRPVILLLHGEPSWSYLYRKMIPRLVDQGFRTIAPDLLGFGKSDKLQKKTDYSYQLLVDIKTEFVKKLDLDIAVLFIQDWGSLVGLRLLETVGNRVHRVVLANGGLPAMDGISSWFAHSIFKLRVKFNSISTEDDLRENLNFLNWVTYTQKAKEFPIGNIIQSATLTELSSEELAAYDAPYPDESYKTGARILPMLVTSQLRKNKQVWNSVLKNWKKPFLTIFGDSDPITKGGQKIFLKKVPGTKDLDHAIIEASHFIQEDAANELVDRIVALYQQTPKA